MIRTELIQSKYTAKKIQSKHLNVGQLSSDI
uniref:Uncharacterized protein n=1 Tax=Anguilla anguilla TaxID=7936 RepID=A0A0E9SQN7_ANGAN